jgi:hypothetical protein
MARTLHQFVDRGATFESFISISDDTVDLTTYDEVRGKMKKHYDASNSVSMVCAARDSSTLRLYMDAETTALLDAEHYVYDVELVTGDTVIRVVQGLVYVIPSV